MDSEDILVCKAVGLSGQISNEAEGLTLAKNNFLKLTFFKFCSDGLIESNLSFLQARESDAIHLTVPSRVIF